MGLLSVNEATVPETRQDSLNSSQRVEGSIPSQGHTWVVGSIPILAHTLAHTIPSPDTYQMQPAGDSLSH